jgi:hypothetical protein
LVTGYRTRAKSTALRSWDRDFRFSESADARACGDRGRHDGILWDKWYVEI